MTASYPSIDRNGAEESGAGGAFAIRVSALSKTLYPDGRALPVLDGVDFHARRGEFVSIIGPSGCGKSTLLNIVAGLDSPTSGEAALDGVADGAGRLGAVGYMQQKDLLMPWRDVLGNAILGLEIQGVPKREAVARAREHLARFGLDGFERAYPHELSGGMRQRAAFLRTLLAGHDVFLLDEPFGALDALNRSRIHRWLTGIWESMNKTIALVTHDVDEAILLADRVCVMTARPGRVKMVRRVELPRPRAADVSTSPEFVRLKADLLAAIREESGDGGGDFGRREDAA